MKIFVKEQLSEHKYKTPQGYLICTDAIIARTGKQTYKKSTFFPDAADAETDIEVDRHEKDVFDEATMASFENMPITIDHPQEEVNSTNNKKYSVGYVRDVHKGEFEGKPVMKANLVFTDDEAIRKIENGEMVELSCGYDCDVKDEHNPYQENIRGNHVALCQRGRAGIARIQDSIESSTKKVEELGETRFIEYDEKSGKYFIASGDSRFDSGFDTKEEAKEFWLKNKDFIRKRVARDSNVKDDAEMVTVQCYIFSRDYKQILTQERIGPVWPGIAVPGGHVKPDETPLDACVREVREETGLEVRQLRLFGTHNYECKEDGRSIALLFTTNDFYGQLHDCDEGINRWYDVNEVLASPKCAEGFQRILSKCMSNSFVGDTDVDDALVQNQQELDFIKNAKQIKNAGGKIFVLKDDTSGYCSFDGGKTWYSGNVRILPERDGGRKQESRWLRVAAMGHEGVISLAKLKYATQYGEIPQGYEVDHLNANHMDDRMSNYQLVSSAENQLRNKVRITARRQQDTQGYVSRSAIAKVFGKQQLDLLERYNDYDRFTFKDSIKDESEEHKSLRRALKNVRVDTHQEMKQLLVDLINDKFMNYSPEVRQLKKTIESIIRWSDNLQEARDTIFRIAKEEHVIDSIKDALVDEPKAWTEMKSAIQAKGYRFDKEGKTLFGRHHLEFTSNNVIGEQNFRNECIKLANEVDRIERKYNTPSTYNFGLQQDGKIHAVIDIDKKYVKDEMPDVVKTALKMVKSIKH